MTRQRAPAEAGPLPHQRGRTGDTRGRLARRFQALEWGFAGQTGTYGSWEGQASACSACPGTAAWPRQRFRATETWRISSPFAPPLARRTRRLQRGQPRGLDLTACCSRRGGVRGIDQLRARRANVTKPSNFAPRKGWAGARATHNDSHPPACSAALAHSRDDVIEPARLRPASCHRADASRGLLHHGGALRVERGVGDEPADGRFARLRAQHLAVGGGRGRVAQGEEHARVGHSRAGEE
mmetsp:Transcript_495/g.1893  ORF Transcript_495/g.1893 Transcript_495/m.1893 type:complete len:240 (+) Transcript_495:1118-1837(+)